MDDTIYRQAAIEALWKALYEYEDKMEKQFVESDELDVEDWIQHRIFVQNMSDIDRQTILELPSAQRWTPCSKRLPDEEEKCYWVCTNTGYQCQCRWTNNVFGIRDSDRWGWKIFDIPQYTHEVAWMLLPDPYREDGDENG